MCEIEYKDSQVVRCYPDYKLRTNSKPKPASEELVFGKFFTDHMLRIHWTQNQGWSEPRITPFQHFQMHPAAKALHYAQEIYEGKLVNIQCI